jgi:hypothetical protein
MATSTMPLSRSQVDAFQHDGFLFPMSVFTNERSRGLGG